MAERANGQARISGGRWYSPSAPLLDSSRPFRGHPLERFNGHRAQAPYNTPALLDAFGNTIPMKGDLAFPPPRESLPENINSVATLIHREVPIVTTQTGWTPPQVRDAITKLTIGLFDASSQLSDTVLADSRVAATMASRAGGIFGRPVIFRTAPGFEDDEDAKQARRVWERNWPSIMPESAASELLRWVIMQAFGVAQLLWEPTAKWLIPTPSVWHPRYSYYHWLYRAFVAITQDGQVPVTPGDGHWVLHAPHGAYRGWMRGAVWSIAPWWLARQYALRDWSRYSERHGMPIILALTPAAASAESIAAYRNSLATLGQETIVQLPQGVERQYSFGMDLLEATDQGWMGFHQLIEQCNTEITLAIMGQNLTTEVKEGSFAAARVHADVRQTLLQADARALERTIYQQIARPFAMMNWGRPEIAPVTEFDLEPYEDAKTAAQTFQAFAAAIFELRRAGKDVENINALAEGFGLKGGKIKDVPPLTTGGGGGAGGGGGLR